MTLVSPLTIDPALFADELQFVMGCLREVLEESGEPELARLVPWAAGGGTDALARTLVKNAKQHLGVNVNVVNRALYLQNYRVFAAPVSAGQCHTFDPATGTFEVRVGLIDPLALAEGAASGRPTVSRSARITGCAGTRRPMVGNPAVTSDAIGASGFSGTTRVRGPGQCSSASFRATSSNTPKRSAASRSSTWTISGLKLGRPLAS